MFVEDLVHGFMGSVELRRTAKPNVALHNRQQMTIHGTKTTCIGLYRPVFSIVQANCRSLKSNIPQCKRRAIHQINLPSIQVVLNERLIAPQTYDGYLATEAARKR